MYRCGRLESRSSALLLLCIVAQGCHTPQHSNVLIFATNTKGGIDISYDPKTQEPNLVVGYKRQEGVWMPLLANLGKDGLTPGVAHASRSKPNKQKPSQGNSSTPATDATKDGEETTVVAVTTDGKPSTTAAASQPKPTTPGKPGPQNDGSHDQPGLVRVPAGYLYVGQDGRNIDTYSVLASFGAKFTAKGSRTGGPEASGGLAQYFATGLAARRLAETGGERLVSVQPADAVAAKYAALDEDLFTKQKRLDELLAKKLKPGTQLDGKDFEESDTQKFANALAAKKGKTLKTLRRMGGSDLDELIKQLDGATIK